MQLWALVKLVEAVAKAGDLDRAERLTRKIMIRRGCNTRCSDWSVRSRRPVTSIGPNDSLEISPTAGCGPRRWPGWLGVLYTDRKADSASVIPVEQYRSGGH
jgi:hypothetical protein